MTVPSEGTNILECNRYQKSDKAQFISHADRECLIEKIDVMKFYVNPNSEKLKYGAVIELSQPMSF